MIELKELTLGYGQRTLLETVNTRITADNSSPCWDVTGREKVPCSVL